MAEFVKNSDGPFAPQSPALTTEIEAPGVGSLQRIKISHPTNSLNLTKQESQNTQHVWRFLFFAEHARTKLWTRIAIVTKPRRHMWYPGKNATTRGVFSTYFVRQTSPVPRNTSIARAQLGKVSTVGHLFTLLNECADSISECVLNMDSLVRVTYKHCDACSTIYIRLKYALCGCCLKIEKPDFFSQSLVRIRRKIS